MKYVISLLLLSSCAHHRYECKEFSYKLMTIPVTGLICVKETSNHVSITGNFKDDKSKKD